METIADLGVTGFIELPPAGTLAGLAKRALPGVETVALKTPDDLARRPGPRRPRERPPAVTAAAPTTTPG